MQLKVGELAKRSGLTVRALHHYHAIGLLSPSARAENGYRLYGRDDIARLHQIQALRRFGLSLAEIGAFLDQPGVRWPASWRGRSPPLTGRSSRPRNCARDWRNCTASCSAARNRSWPIGSTLWN